MAAADSRIAEEEARRLCRRAFACAGLPAGDAAMATEQFILCDLFGIDGLFAEWNLPGPDPNG